jgi:hypothetical protein
MSGGDVPHPIFEGDSFPYWEDHMKTFFIENVGEPRLIILRR